MRGSVYIFCPSVLRFSNLKLHQTLQVKTILKLEKIIPQLTFNPGLTLTGFRTTQPRTLPLLRVGLRIIDFWSASSWYVSVLSTLLQDSGLALHWYWNCVNSSYPTVFANLMLYPRLAVYR